MASSSVRIGAIHRLAALLLGTVLALPLGTPVVGALSAQTVEVTAEQENFRQEPMGKRLATVERGTELRVVGRDGRWRQVVLEGWIWTPSVSSTSRGGQDLVVSADGGENLRSEPSPRATILARLLEGFLLTEVGTRGSWTRVRRTGWMWAPSLSEASGGGGGPSARPAGGGEGGAPGDAGAGEGGAPGDAGAGEGGGEATGGAAAGAAPAAGGDGEHRVVEGSPAGLHVSPDGDTLAVARRGTDLTVLDRQGDWIRVRLDGWVRASDLVPPDSASASRELSLDELRDHPDRYRGRKVRWTVQYISLERAEAARTDFYEGEPFVLARPTAGDGTGFVYLAVPPELVSRVERLRPLQEIRVLGRVRTGRSALMGAPVLDLLELHTPG